MRQRLLGQEDATKINKAGSEMGLTEDELQMIVDLEEESYRMGNFERIYPCADFGFQSHRAANN
jgi:hypothetical protein